MIWLITIAWKKRLKRLDTAAPICYNTLTINEEIMLKFDRKVAGEVFWEDYKTVTGMRPRSHRFYDADCSDAEAQSIAESYSKWAEETIQREYDEQERQIKVFEEKIALIQNLMDCDEDRAIYHYVVSLKPEAYDLRDVGYLCYINDLPYHLEHVLAPAAKQLLEELEDA